MTNYVAVLFILFSLPTTQPDTAIGNALSIIYNHVTVVMRCFDSKYLIAINLKNMRASDI